MDKVKRGYCGYVGCEDEANFSLKAPGQIGTKACHAHLGTMVEVLYDNGAPTVHVERVRTVSRAATEPAEQRATPGAQPATVGPATSTERGAS